MMGRLIFLIGAPNCGKSTLGRRVAELMQLPFYDTDEMVRAKIGETRLFDAFSSYAQVRFQKEQRNAVFSLTDLIDPAIVATGAEIALIPVCVDAMRNAGYIIHIKRNIESVLEEVRSSANKRTVLVEVNNGTIFDFREQAVLAYADDLPNYEAVADFTLENNGSEDDGIKLLRAIIQAKMLIEDDS